MLVTINTDASFHNDYNAGAFAFWAVSDNFKLQKAGYFKKLCKSSDEAEMKCIINAVTSTLSSNKTISKAIINTDSLNSIAVFTNDKKHIKRWSLKKYHPLRHQFNIALKKHARKNIIIEFRHVKAHSEIEDARSYVNEWCDKNAKFYLWRLINSKIKKGIEIDF